MKQFISRRKDALCTLVLNPPKCRTRRLYDLPVTRSRLSSPLKTRNFLSPPAGYYTFHEYSAPVMLRLQLLWLSLWSFRYSA